MLGTIRKHQTWVWAVIITLTIISFVSFLSPNSKLNAGRGSENHGSINGERISQVDFNRAYHEVDLHTFFMSGGHWLNEDKKQTRIDPERETYQWIFLTQLQRELNIHVRDDAAAGMAQKMSRSFDPMVSNTPAIFIRRVSQPHAIGVEVVQRFLRTF